jgi:hypothetical protein
MIVVQTLNPKFTSCIKPWRGIDNVARPSHYYAWRFPSLPLILALNALCAVDNATAIPVERNVDLRGSDRTEWASHHKLNLPVHTPSKRYQTLLATTVAGST